MKKRGKPGTGKIEVQKYRVNRTFTKRERYIRLRSFELPIQKDNLFCITSTQLLFFHNHRNRMNCNLHLIY